MKKIIILLIVAASSLNINAQVDDINKLPTVETTASVDTLVIPDRIYLSIRLDEKDTKGKVSIETIEKRMESALESAGIDLKEQLSLSGAGSDFSKYFLRKKDVSKEKTYTLLVYDATTLSDVMINLEKVDISNVGLQKVEYSKTEELMIALRSKVVLQAKQQAEALASPLGQKIGNAIMISDMNAGNAFNRLNYGALDEVVITGYNSRAKSKIASTVDFKKIKITASVRVRFHLH